MNNKQRMAILASELESLNMSTLALILTKALDQMPDWANQHIGAYEFMDIIKYTLKVHLSRRSLEPDIQFHENSEAQHDELHLICQQARRAHELIHVHEDKVLVTRVLASHKRAELKDDFREYFRELKLAA